ncbi:hypothetical protein HLH33_13690 [Gluconacetobacter diazotrophicus]|uniref:Large polyvalent protein associated domain-containing protein n=1 Tax=Gluconacetobacter diazotrophicus TaxID=33996 RepID=A0A7W4I6W4_GLUDI|nr:LPD29 domain-containing protein [Gluconacetobacter diazotrophicus]MBB2157352.1 hypothetical protein [Gluconacetobacter diazotrophicus]
MNSQNEPIVVGTMVSTMLYNRGRGYVVAIHGSQRPETVQPRFGGIMMSGGSASFDIVFESGTYSRRLPEAILHGVQWTVYPRAKGFADQATLGHLCQKADAIAAQRKADAAAAQAAFDQKVAELQADPAHAALVQGDTGDGVIAAKNIRVLLKAAFPGVKFSVRKDHYGSLRVNWSDGPDARAVEDITDRFRSGHYDSHSDCHGSKTTPWMKVFGHADYISTSRG